MNTPSPATDVSLKASTVPGRNELPDEPFPLLDYLQLLWFRRRLIILLTVFAGIFGYLYAQQLQSIYTAQSTLLIGVQDSKPADLNQVLYQRYFGLEAAEELELLRSRGLAEKVITRMGLLRQMSKAI